MSTSKPDSSWIQSVHYHRGFLALVTINGDALLYGDTVPSWIPGLLCAGTGRRSPGLAYNRLVKGKYDYQRIEKEKVDNLIQMMES